MKIMPKKMGRMKTARMRRTSLLKRNKSRMLRKKNQTRKTRRNLKRTKKKRKKTMTKMNLNRIFWNQSESKCNRWKTNSLWKMSRYYTLHM